MQNDPIVQELQDYIEANNLPPTEKLLLRMAKHGHILRTQIMEDIGEMKLDIIELKKDKSVLWFLKNKPMPTMTMIASICLFFYIVFHIIEESLGFDVLLKTLVP